MLSGGGAIIHRATGSGDEEGCTDADRGGHLACLGVLQARPVRPETTGVCRHLPRKGIYYVLCSMNLLEIILKVFFST